MIYHDAQGSQLVVFHSSINCICNDHFFIELLILPYNVIHFGSVEYGKVLSEKLAIAPT